VNTGLIEHRPVLCQEVLDWLQPAPGKRMLDATLGLGGHSLALLQSCPQGLEVLGLDQDGQALQRAAERIEQAGCADRFHGLQRPFTEFQAALGQVGWDRLDGVLMDLGLSSLQLDDAERGFSFVHNGPLDMRMDREGNSRTAAELIRTLPQDRLRRIIREYGEEPMSGRIARAIVEARQAGRIEETFQLAEIVSRAYPAKRRATSRNHPATKTFQALRIAVNAELERLADFLESIPDFLAQAGRIAVISFHSLEDRVVKQAFKREAAGCSCPRDQAVCTCQPSPRLRILTKKPLVPGDAERSDNPRSRSAKLRVAEALSGSTEAD
jgi:16S rRNA (cytosine1402-N4)-methyltransferase